MITIPSLKSEDPDATALDEFYRITILKIMILAPAYYVREVQKMPGLVNGAILSMPSWSTSSYLIAWKALDKDLLHCGAINKKTFQLTPLENMFFNFIWNGAYYEQEEARVTPVTDDKFFLIATARFSRHSPFTEVYGYANLNRTTGNFSFDPPIWLDYQRDRDNKNFVPLVYNETVYLLPSINPLVVLTVEYVNSDMFGIPKIIHSGEPIHMPWRKEYGEHIRGWSSLNIRIQLLFILLRFGYTS